MADDNDNVGKSNTEDASSSRSSSQRAQASLTPLRVQRDPSEKDESGSQPARGRVAGSDLSGGGSSLPSTSSSLQSSSGAPGFMKNTLDAVLRSPTVMMGAMKKMNSRNVVKARTSVDPYRRAADQAVYRTSTLVHEASLDEERAGAGETEGKDEGVRTIRYGRWEEAGEGAEAEAGRGRWGKKKGGGGLNAELMKVGVGLVCLLGVVCFGWVPPAWMGPLFLWGGREGERERGSPTQSGWGFPLPRERERESFTGRFALVHLHTTHHHALTRTPTHPVSLFSRRTTA